jgi:hypothetical protein
MEIGADLGDSTPNQTWRDMMLRHNRERAELLFNYDPEAPAPEDPVNDYAAIAPVDSSGVKAEVEKFGIKVTAPDYEIKVDPVHGGRISRWYAFGRELLARNYSFGWALPGNWCPAGAAFNLGSGVVIESVKAIPEGVEIVMTKVLTEDDNAPLQGVTYKITDVYGKNGFCRTLRITNTTQETTPDFTFRFHSMPTLMGGPGLPTGTVVMDDGATYERDGKDFCFRLGGVRNPGAEKVGKPVMIDTKGRELSITASDIDGKVVVSYPAVLPAIIYCWEPQNRAGSCEAIFESVSLKPGESCEFAIAVKHSK